MSKNLYNSIQTLGLPYEPWLQCLLFAVIDSADGPLPYLDVCSYWRKTALQSPTLWSTIVIDGGHDEQARIHTFLHLSKSQPLDIIYTATMRKQPGEKGLQAALKEALRFRSFRIMGTSQQRITWLLNTLVQTSSLFSQLKDFAQEWKNLSEWRPSKFLGISPNLQVLDSGGFSIALKPNSSSSNGLPPLWGFKIEGNGMPDLEPYTFETNNTYLKHGSSSLQAAKYLLVAGNALSEVALMLEAAIQTGDTGEGGYDAWILLGEVRSMDERQELGILALREGVRIATEYGDTSGAGLLSLAISCTNEGYDRSSQLLLLTWLKTRYPQYASKVNLLTAFTQESWSLRSTVQEAFISATKLRKSATVDMDPELQVGLGISFYLDDRFEQAAECFSLALSMRPRDYVLWNRYGGCLTNGNNPEGGLKAYQEALRLSPRYTRAIYNIGVAYLNMGSLNEAAEHFLTALTLQGDESKRVDKYTKRSDQVWSSLRRTFSQMKRPELAERAMDGNLEFFREQGFAF